MGEDVEVEQDRPILDVVKIVLDALLDFLLAVRLAAPAADLRPTGDSRLDAMAGEIAVNCFVVESVLGFGMQGVRARTYQRQFAGNTR